MKKFLIIFLLCFPHLSFAYSLVQGTSTLIGGSVSTTVFFTNPVANGNLIYICTRNLALGRTVTITDPANNAYYQIASSTQVTSTSEIYAHYAIASGDTSQFTLTTSGASVGKRIIAAEYSGVVTSGALNATTSISQDAKTYMNTGIAPSNRTGVELQLGCIGLSSGATLTALSPWAKAVCSPLSCSSPVAAILEASTSSSTPSLYFTNSASNNYAAILSTFRGINSAISFWGRMMFWGRFMFW